MAPNHSQTASVFLEATNELCAKLEGDEDPKSLALLLAARGLADVFRGWLTSRPEAAQRTATVNRLIDLNRKVLIHISKRTRSQ